MTHYTAGWASFVCPAHQFGYNGAAFAVKDAAWSQSSYGINYLLTPSNFGEPTKTILSVGAFRVGRIRQASRTVYSCEKVYDNVKYDYNTRFPQCQPMPLENKIGLGDFHKNNQTPAQMLDAHAEYLNRIRTSAISTLEVPFNQREWWGGLGIPGYP